MSNVILQINRNVNKYVGRYIVEATIPFMILVAPNEMCVYLLPHMWNSKRRVQILCRPN